MDLFKIDKAIRIHQRLHKHVYELEEICNYIDEWELGEKGLVALIDVKRAIVKLKLAITSDLVKQYHEGVKEKNV